jgi:hypothetical protein
LVTTKSFMTAGPTLHYSHQNVLTFWFLAIVAFGLTCAFWSKIVSGTFWSFHTEGLFASENWYLGRFVTGGVSIFEYPWQIVVLGILMGILAVIPVLESQLMSFGYSLPFIAEIIIFANLPGLGLFVLLGCFGAACRPLRFRSRFTAAALCTVPQLFYWGIFGGSKGADPLVWGFSYTPWIFAWVVSLVIAGIILGIGHFTRYRPGLVWAVTSGSLVFAAFLFEFKIGFDELDYQIYVARYNPEQVEEFHTHSITDALDRTINDPVVAENLLKPFYPGDKVALRNELKKEIINSLSTNGWPVWFKVPGDLRYQQKREELLKRFNKFIELRPASKRMPVALYYEAILLEFTPDIVAVEQKEELGFYNDYPKDRAREIWYRLYRDFPESPESLEAGWRIAKHWAGQGEFSKADETLSDADQKLAKKLTELEAEKQPTESIFSPFRPPAGSVMTVFKLRELDDRIGRLRSLISPWNHTDGEESLGRLAKFVKLNPHSQVFSKELEVLLGEMGPRDALRDNVLLAQTMLIADEQLRAERLSELNKKYQKTDGGTEALYELCLLKKRFLTQQEANSEQKKKIQEDLRAALTNFLNLYPDSIYTEKVKGLLGDLPKAE